MGYLAYSGDMTGSSPHFGSYPSADIPGGTLGGPLAVFTADLETSFVISSASSFMMHTCYNIHDMLHYGVAGEVEALPAGYSMETIVYVGSGVNALFDGWGKTMRQYYGKDMAFKARDMTLQFLGYSTDNGVCDGCEGREGKHRDVDGSQEKRRKENYQTQIYAKRG